ncbi:MAG TPA: hypothetical protein PK252_07830 [Bacteroidales bacterium]|nr:hypothetical protein [Bacteroidales bacterium]
MKNRILTVTLGLAFLLTGVVSTFGQARKKAMRDMEDYRYELECVGVGAQGTYLIKVWTYSKKPKVAIAQAKKNAIHGVIFKGFPGGGQGCTSQQPFATPADEDKNIDFFEKFFADGGDYMRYVAESSDGSIGAEDRLKVGKEYKIGIVVSVQKDLLRKDLEKAGIIRALDSGF